MADLIRDFGAVPGGDCTAAIQAAVAWLNARSGESLLIRPGVYGLTQPVTITAPCSIAGFAGGFGVYSTRIELTGAGKILFAQTATGAHMQGLAVGGWASRVAGPAIEARGAVTFHRVGVMTADVGLLFEGTIGIGNANLARLSHCTASDCGVGFDAKGNDANSWTMTGCQAVFCGTGYRVRSVIGGPSIIGCFAECASGRGFDVQPSPVPGGGGGVKIVGCYDESMLPAIVNYPSQLIGWVSAFPHVGANGSDPATEIGSVAIPSYVRALHGQGADPRVWATLGDPQRQGEVGIDLFLDGDGSTTQRMQVRCPYFGATRADSWEWYVPGKTAIRVARSDGAYPRGTVQIPRLLVGGTDSPSMFAIGAGVVDVVAKLANLEARIAALEP